ncbi:hypothetical protein [Flavobacterium psychrophilum]|uniref:hypothetical protein n=1 Tax=Flavobacterium psychrophilum TaxID=96345 RepID=UPI001D089CC2|nr:hypothetical protein [Flavobacterium psychrophilum]MCB6062514.1 hypothetical protein [Flavobacterium psychrophilum]
MIKIKRVLLQQNSFIYFGFLCVVFMRFFYAFRVARVLPTTSPRFAGFSRELALEENLAKRVMEEHRAKATMVFHRPRSGGSMEKIVPKGDFFHRSHAWRQLRTSELLIFC